MKNIVRRDPRGTVISYEDSPLPSLPLQEETSYDLRGLLNCLARRKFLIFLTALLALVPVGVASYLATPMYRSTALIEIDPEPVRVLPYRDVAEFVTGQQNYELYMKTQDQILRSPTLMSRVTERLRSESPEIPEEDLRQLPYQIEIGRIGNSQLFQLASIASSPKVAARVVNVFAEEFIKHHFEIGQQTREKATAFLERELVKLKRRVELSEKELVEYAEENDMLALEPGQVDLVRDKLTVLAKQLSDLEAQRMTAEAQLKALREASVENFPEALRSENISSLVHQLFLIEQELTRLTSRFGENWPAVQSTRREYEVVNSQLERAKESILAEALRQAEFNYDSILTRYNQLAGALARQELLVHELNEASIQYNILRREVSTNEELYQGLLERLKQTSVTAGLELGNIHVVEPGRPIPRVYSPRILWNLSLGGIFGLALGVCLAFFLDFMDNTISSPEQVENLLATPVLGVIPVVKDMNRNGRAKTLSAPTQLQLTSAGRKDFEGKLSSVAFPPGVVEAYRTIGAAILLSNPDSAPKRILVTSAVPNEGKSTIAFQLGKLYAESGAKTVLVDFDLRRAKLSNEHGGENEQGLSLFLSGHYAKSSLPHVHKTHASNLFFITAGPKPPNPLALLSSERLSGLMATLAEIFRFVLIDTPPVLTVADARVLCPQVDGVVLVVRAGKTPAKLLQRAKQQVELAGGRVLGIVLNGAKPHGASYSHYERYFSDEKYYSNSG